jgi:hypothetical protein
MNPETQSQKKGDQRNRRYQSPPPLTISDFPDRDEPLPLAAIEVLQVTALFGIDFISPTYGA